MKTHAIRIIQRALADMGRYTGEVDGLRGPMTDAAVASALTARASELPPDWRGWSPRRRAVAFLQLLCRDEGIETGPVDGLWGPQTEFAYDSLVYLQEHGALPPPWRDEHPLEANPHGWPPQTEAALRAFYGPPCEPPLVRVRCPWTLRLAWNRRQTLPEIACHERVAQSLERVLTRVLDHYGADAIRYLGLDLFGGCYNCRRMRGGSRWSTHAWAIALDWDPDRNRYRWGRDRARLARPEYADWWRFWEEEGWVSLGRTRNIDWMHVQAAKL